MIALPFVTFGVMDPQHYGKILTFLAMALIPLALSVLHKKATFLPPSGLDTSFLFFATVGWIITVPTAGVTAIALANGDSGEGFIGLILPLVLASIAFSLALITGFVKVLRK